MNASDNIRSFANPHPGNTVAVILAGGKGTRLGALTRHECKPALPFGGVYRNIDFSLSNCVNSGIHRIGVATQYKDDSLIRHIARVWQVPGDGTGRFVESWRADRCARGTSYRGTADAVFRNWAKINSFDPGLVLVLAGDHVYKMDYRHMLLSHMAQDAEVTVGCVEIPIAGASQFGVMSVDSANRIVRFSEKPSDPECLPGRPDRALGSMGIYVFNKILLGRLLREDASLSTSSHDFGRDLIPRLIKTARVFAFPFASDAPVGRGYWRDVGTVPAYWHAHMEFVDGVAGFRLDDAAWPIRVDQRSQGRTLFGACHLGDSGVISNSVLAAGCAIDRARIRRAVLSVNVRIGANSRVSNAVILPGAVIGRDCHLRNVVVAAGARVPDGSVIASSYHHGRISHPALVTAETGLRAGTGEQEPRKRTGT